MDFDTIMEKAYEEYFEGLAEGEEALSFSEFKQALRYASELSKDLSTENKTAKSDRRKLVCSETARPRRKFPIRAHLTAYTSDELDDFLVNCIQKQPSMPTQDTEMRTKNDHESASQTQDQYDLTLEGD
ncbi:hypothetical protein O5624_00085 [Escherichia coli]|nr:hypothetical protein [Escherichia coli]